MIRVIPINFVLRSFKKHEYFFEFLLTHRCNLNCKNCSRFAPFYDKTSDVSFEEFKEDFDIVSEFSDFKNIKRINLSGGEATIVKDFIKIVEYTRSKFKGQIFVCTNGLKLQTFSDAELENFKKLDVGFVMTKYLHTNIDYNKVCQRLDHFGIKYEYFLDFNEHKSDRDVFLNKYYVSKKLKPVFRQNHNCCATFPHSYKGKVYPCTDMIPSLREFKGAPLKDFKSFKDVIHYILNDKEKDYWCERCLINHRNSIWEVDKNRKIDFYFLSKKDEEYYCE